MTNNAINGHDPLFDSDECHPCQVTSAAEVIVEVEAMAAEADVDA